MIVELLAEHHLECLSLKRGRRGSSESTLVKMSNCWKSHVMTHIIQVMLIFQWLDQPLVPYSRGEASLIFLWNRLNAFKKGTYANSEYPDENAASHQGLRCLPR